MIIDADWLWLTLIDADWFWLMLMLMMMLMSIYNFADGADSDYVDGAGAGVLLIFNPKTTMFSHSF